MTIMLDHISLSVADYDKAKAFYAAALGPLRVDVLMEFPMGGGTKVMGLGADGHAFLWISGGGKATHSHIALRAESREQVDAFHAAAIAAGGKDNGGPGIREMYDPSYYAAYVLDPEGHNIEAVTHAPAKAATRKPARRVAGKATAKKATAKKATAKKTPAKRGAPARRTAAKKPAGRKKAR